MFFKQSNEVTEKNLIEENIIKINVEFGHHQNKRGIWASTVQTGALPWKGRLR